MRLSDSSDVNVPVLRPVGRLAITIAVLCGVIALSMDVFAFLNLRALISRVAAEPVECTESACGVVARHVNQTVATTLTVASLTWVLAGLGVALAVPLWIWRARANAEVLSPVPPRLSRWWSVGCWFIPIANLVLPPRVLVDIWTASCAGSDPRDEHVPGVRLVRAWWVAQRTCIVVVLLFVLVGARVVDINGYSEADQVNVLAILFAVVGHGAAALFAAIVLKLSADQTRAMNVYRRLAGLDVDRVGDGPRRPVGHVIASLLALVLLVGFGLTAHRVWAPPELEPSQPAGRHPVVVHDCDLDAGNFVQEKRNPPPEAGRTIDVHAIEVYQTLSDRRFREHPEGAADVHMHATIRPQVLVLKAYEPTLWRVHADEGVTIAMVVLDGYHPQRIEGAPAGIEVVTRENWPAIPNRELALLAETPPASETYCHIASQFSVRQYTDEPGE